MAKILIVDDQVDVAAMIKQVLEEDGHHCTVELAGADLLARIAGTDYDLAITDIVMPDIDGIAVIRYLVAKHPQTRILAISGNTGNLPAPIGLLLSRAHGAGQILYKPFSPSELRNTVTRALAETA